MKRNSESGQALVFTALALVVLVGFAGLAIDMGVLRYQKRVQQNAADAAALAGASNLASTSGGVTAGAQSASATNGFTDTGGGQTSACTASGATVGTVCVQVNNPPLSGPHASGTNAGKYVEVLVAVVQPTYFMKIFGVNSEAITARAVATNLSGGTGGGCLYTLGPPSSGIGVDVTGSAVLNATSCGIVDNGNFGPTGGALTVNAGTFGVAGSCSGSGCGKGSVTCSGTPDSCPTYGMPAGADPLASVTPPSQPAASSSCPGTGSCDVTTKGTVTLQPGTYNSITIGKNSTVTLASGIYYFGGGGGLTFKGAGTVSSAAGGVMFYFTCTTSCPNGGTFNATGGGDKADIELSPMSSGPYAGILVYQNPADTTGPSFGGDDSSSFGGVLYFPTATLTFFGKATSYSTGIVIADSLALSGNPTVNLLGAAGLPAGVNILANAVLVE
jgi:Flp pilus assembly protein TadG